MKIAHSSFGDAIIVSMTFKDMAFSSTALSSLCFLLSAHQNILMSERFW